MLGSNSGFSNKLHSLNLGSIQGKSVLGLPIDVYFAYGYTGVILFPFIYSILINKFDKVLRKSNYTIIYVCRIYLFITISFISFNESVKYRLLDFTKEQIGVKSKNFKIRKYRRVEKVLLFTHKITIWRT